jgi:hypothetical protein
MINERENNERGNNEGENNAGGNNQKKKEKICKKDSPEIGVWICNKSKQ